jgi:hypothetical protein
MQALDRADGGNLASQRELAQHRTAPMAADDKIPPKQKVASETFKVLGGYPTITANGKPTPSA